MDQCRPCALESRPDMRTVFLDPRVDLALVVHTRLRTPRRREGLANDLAALALLLDVGPFDAGVLGNAIPRTDHLCGEVRLLALRLGGRLRRSRRRGQLALAGAVIVGCL